MKSQESTSLVKLLSPVARCDPDNRLISDYLVRSLRGRIEAMTRNKYSLKILRMVRATHQMSRLHEYQSTIAEMTIEELESLLATERVHFFVLGLVRSVQSSSRMEIARRLLALFRSDKHTIRESASNLINECLCLMSNLEVAPADRG